MAAIRLTHIQDQTLSNLITYKGGYIRPHVKGAKRFYRLLDAKLNPVYNLDYSAVRSLFDHGHIKIDGERFTITNKK